MAFWKWYRRNYVPLAPFLQEGAILASMGWEWKLPTISCSGEIDCYAFWGQYFEVPEIAGACDISCVFLPFVTDVLFQSTCEIGLSAVTGCGWMIRNPQIAGQSSIEVAGVLANIDERADVLGSLVLRNRMILDGSLQLCSGIASTLRDEIETINQIRDSFVAGSLELSIHLIDREEVSGALSLSSNMQEDGAAISSYYWDKNWGI